MVGDGEYSTACRSLGRFVACNQLATAYSVALNTTYTGLVISNPAGSERNLEILKASFALTVAPVAIASMGLFGGYLAAGITTHTTALTVYDTELGETETAVGLADAAATLVGTPIWLMPFLGGFTAGALHGTTPSIIDLGGIIVVPPGAYFGIGALTAVTGFGSIVWREVASS